LSAWAWNVHGFSGASPIFLLDNAGSIILIDTGSKLRVR